jgi:4-amino-4-deoxy-L-arabinose transferase-like glycosyltransferase
VIVETEAARRTPGTPPRGWQAWRSLGSRRGWAIACAAVILLAALLRLWRLDLTVFDRDEAAIAWLAEDILFGHWPLAGPVFSAGVPSAAHFMYLLAPAVAVSRDPAFLAGAIAVANVAGLALLVRLGWTWFGSLAGVAAGLAYASNPWAVFYARRIWQPDLLPPLAVLLVWVLDRALTRRSATWAAASLPVFTLGVLVHPSFVTLGPLLVAAASVVVRSRRWLPLVPAAGLAVLISLPFLLYQVQTRWKSVADFRYLATLNTSIDREPLEYALAVTTGWSVHAEQAVPPLAIGTPVAVLGLGVVLAMVLLGTGVVSCGVAACHPSSIQSGASVRGNGRRFARWRLFGLLAWLVLPVLLTIRHALPVHAHYYLVIQPAAALLTGCAVAWLWSRRGALTVPARVVAALGLAALVLIQSVSVVRSLSVFDASADGPCFGPLLRTVAARQGELVAFGATAGATRASLEANADESMPLAYVLRDNYGSIDLSGVGAFGTGTPRGTTTGASATADAVLVHRERVERDLAPDIRLLDVAVSDQGQRGQRVYVALTWAVDQAAVARQPYVWNVALLDGQGSTVLQRAGVDHVPLELAGQQAVSWFVLNPADDDRRVLDSGTYDVQVRLDDAWNYTRSEPISAGSVQVGPPRVCTG